MSQQINLFNPIFIRQRKYFSLLSMLQALGMIIAGSLLFYGYAIYQVERLKLQTQENTQHYNAEQKRFTRNGAELSPQQSRQLLQDEVRRLENQYAERKAMIETLKATGNTAGYSEYMRAFARQTLPGLWLTSFKVSGEGEAAQINLSGGVVNPELLPAYIQRLGRERIMQGKIFSTLKMQQSSAYGGAGAAQPPAIATRSYVQFTLDSDTEGEVNK